MTNKEHANILSEMFKSTIYNFFECNRCVHNKICKLKENASGKNCEHYRSELNPNIYGNIYELFDPIFEWLKIHYPSGDVKFFVDNNSARMYIEHGAFVVDKQLRSSMNEGENKNG